MSEPARRSGRAAADRVVRSHRQTRTTVALALAFVGTAVVVWAAGGAWWVPLHLFLAGGLVMAISGVSLMLTVTWSAAPAPPDGVVWAQRAAVGVGAAGVVAGRHFDWGDAVVLAAGALYGVGLLLLGVLLIVTVRRGVERRFDPAVVAYVLAVAAGTAGVVLGVTMAVDPARADLRAAHTVLNALGLVGLVVGGTLPFFSATVGRSRMAPHATAGRVLVLIAWQAAAVAVATAGLVTEVGVVTTAGMVAYAAGILGILGHVPRPTRRQWRWAGPRLAGLWVGSLWWVTAVVALAVTVEHGGAGFERRWLAVLVVAGYGQILWGSLAYLLPVLRGGGHERLGEGFGATRSWLGLAAANVTGVALAVEAGPVAAAALVLWVADAGVRAAPVGFGRPASVSVRPASSTRG